MNSEPLMDLYRRRNLTLLDFRCQDRGKNSREASDARRVDGTLVRQHGEFLTPPLNEIIGDSYVVLRIVFITKARVRDSDIGPDARSERNGALTGVPADRLLAHLASYKWGHLMGEATPDKVKNAFGRLLVKYPDLRGNVRDVGNQAQALLKRRTRAS